MTHRGIIRRTGLGLLACAVAGAVGATSLQVPSGQPVTLHEAIWDETDGLWLRLRFLAPEIARDGGSIGFAEAEPDMIYLCETVALPKLATQDRVPDRIVISLSDRVVEFGTTDPDATQFFEVFRPQDGLCIWEAF